MGARWEGRHRGKGNVRGGVRKMKKGTVMRLLMIEGWQGGGEALG